MHAGEAPGRMYGGSSSSNNETLHAQSCTQERELKGRAKGLTAFTSLCAFATTTLAPQKQTPAGRYVCVCVCVAVHREWEWWQQEAGSAARTNAHQTHKDKSKQILLPHDFSQSHDNASGAGGGSVQNKFKNICRALLCLVTFTFP